MAQACYVDWKYPISNLDEQMKKVAEIEATYGWKLVKTVLSQILNFDEQDVEGKLKHLWIYLNKHAHPSVKQMDTVARSLSDFHCIINVS